MCTLHLTPSKQVQSGKSKPSECKYTRLQPITPPFFKDLAAGDVRLRLSSSSLMDAQRLKRKSIIYGVFIWSFTLELKRDRNAGLISVDAFSCRPSANKTTLVNSQEGSRSTRPAFRLSCKQRLFVLLCRTRRAGEPRHEGNGGQRGPETLLYSARLGFPYAYTLKRTSHPCLF